MYFVKVVIKSLSVEELSEFIKMAGNMAKFLSSVSDDCFDHYLGLLFLICLRNTNLPLILDSIKVCNLGIHKFSYSILANKIHIFLKVLHDGI